ncbi:Glutathione-S-transferase [Dactylella cylindrospora]|nr:Glutathione-S-transferase [Dactylella cylindrospora]
METGAILLYLADNYDPEHKLSFPKNSREHWEMVQWLMWQMANLGPMQGQAGHFFRYAPEKIPYGINRYQTEVRRLYGILNKRLEEQESKGLWIVGDHVSMADVTCFGWAAAAEWVGVDLSEFPYVKKWIEQIEAIDEVEKGRNVPEPSALRKIMGDKQKMDEMAAKTSAWVIKGMENDAKK